jgi:hypothetical protein
MAFLFYFTVKFISIPQDRWMDFGWVHIGQLYVSCTSYIHFSFLNSKYN